MTSLKTQALNGVKWTTLSALSCSIFQVVKMALLARLIAKEDFGLFATIAVILGFADFFVEAGLGSAVIHKQGATKEDLASAYTINVLLGWFVFLFFYFVSSPIASFYKDSRIIPLLELASLVFLFQPLGRQYDALLRRDLEFCILAKLEIFAAIIGFSISLFLAWHGLGVKALILSQLALTLSMTIVLVWVGIRRYGFNFGFKLEKARYFFRFGVFQVCENSVNYFNTQLDTIIIGRLLGQETLGIFYMAKQLAFRPIQIINPIVNKISFPVFARVQHDKERLKRGFLQVIQSLVVFHFALFSIIAGFSDEIVLVFLGENWELAGNLLKILAFYTMIRAIGNPVGSLLMATGRVDIGLYWNLFCLFYTPPIIFASSKFGVIGIAWGLLGAILVSLVPSWYFLVKKLCGLTFAEYFGPMMKIFLVAMLCFGSLLIPMGLHLKLLVVVLGLFIYGWCNQHIIQALRQR